MKSNAGLIIWIVFLGLIIATMFSGAFISEGNAVRALETQGYTNIKIVDRAWFAISVRGGDKYDAARFEAIATNPIGKTVRVYVFVGWPFKGATIRTF